MTLETGHVQEDHAKPADEKMQRCCVLIGDIPSRTALSLKESGYRVGRNQLEQSGTGLRWQEKGLDDPSEVPR